jgi:hypothetical protein
MPNLSRDDLRFSSLSCTYKFLQSNDAELSICYARLFTSTFYRSACGLVQH